MSSRFPLFQRAYRLRSAGPAEEVDLCLLRVRAGAKDQAVLAPRATGLGYFLAPTGGAISVDTTDFHVERLGPLASLWVRVRLALLFKKKKYLKYDGFSLFSFGPRSERKRFTTFTQHMVNIGAALDGDFITKHSEVLYGWPDDGRSRAAIEHLGPKSTALVVHLYYEDTWADIAGVLKRLSIPFDLIVTTVPGRDSLIDNIRAEFPHAEIEVMENRGRDVRPFLVLLESGRLDRYRYVCKVHGKKSSDGGRKFYLGSIWRRRLLLDLLAAPGLAEATLRRFETDPSIGMIGPRAFRMPSDSYSEALSWADNRPMVVELAGRMGVAPERLRLDFFGGTMFWVRPEALRPLRDLSLASAFPEEKGLLDGGLEHATERLFAISVVAAGYRLDDSGAGPNIAPLLGGF